MKRKNKHNESETHMKFGLSFKFHIIFWSLVQIYYFYTMDLFGFPFARILEIKILYLPFQLIAAYFMLFFLLGKYLYKGRYIVAILGFISTIFIFSYAVYFLVVYGINPFFKSTYVPPNFWKTFLDLETLITDYMRVIFMTPLILICLEFVVSQYNKMKEVEELVAQKASAELNLLKTQIHPNFMLSTLRNLEKLTQKWDKDGQIVIEKLSESLDYILYKGRKDNVRIQDEIDAIKGYITLEKIRFKKTIEINLEVVGFSIEKDISPLILFSFLEFNFKGIEGGDVPFSHCQIRIEEKEGVLTCEICNFKNEASSFWAYDVQKMERQLEISYPNRSTLLVQDLGEEYRINLQIEL
ncbi:MAG: histidine kinase [Saprospiraceae bacterium]|nr:histidine kinase [Saprospiraceae bacterium]